MIGSTAESHRNATMCLMAFGGILFLVAFLMADSGIWGNLPEVKLTVSLPPSLAPGARQDFLVYAFDAADGKTPVRIDLSYCLRPTGKPVGPCGEPLTRGFREGKPLRLLKPGIYAGEIQVPSDLPQGTSFLEISCSRDRSRPPAIFPIRVERDFRLGVFPHQNIIHAGEAFRFTVGALSAVAARPIPGAPIRCKVKTPWGVDTVNRLIRTRMDGTGVFLSYFHPLTPAGLYRFSFFGGGRTIVYDIPVVPSRPLPAVFADFLKPYGEMIGQHVGMFPLFDVIPSFQPQTSEEPLPGKESRGFLETVFGRDPLIRPFLPRTTPVDPPAWKWQRKSGRSDFLDVSLATDRKSLIVRFSPTKRSGLSGCEVWLNGRLHFQQLKKTFANVFYLSSEKPIDETLPFRVVLWERHPGGVRRREGFIPPRIRSGAGRVFDDMLNSLSLPKDGLGMKLQLYQNGFGALVAGELRAVEPFVGKAFRRLNLWLAVGLFAFMVLSLGLTRRLAVHEPDPIHGGLRMNEAGRDIWHWQLAWYGLLIGFLLGILIIPVMWQWWFAFGVLIVFMLIGGIRSEAFAGETGTFFLEKSGITLSIVWMILSEFGPLPLPEGMSPYHMVLVFLGMGMAVFPVLVLGIYRNSMAFPVWQVFLRVAEGLSKRCTTTSAAGVAGQVVILAVLGYVFFQILASSGLSAVLPGSRAAENPLEMPLPQVRINLMLKSASGPSENVLTRLGKDVETELKQAFPLLKPMRNRFFLFDGEMAIPGPKLSRLVVYLSFTDFLQRAVTLLQFRKASLNNLVQEGIARVILYPRLDPQGRAEQQIFLEGILPAVSRALALRSTVDVGNPRGIVLALRFFVQRLAGCLELDSRFVRQMSLPEGFPIDRYNIRDWFNIQSHFRRGSEPAITVFAENEFLEFFRGGGTIHLKGRGGKASRSFVLMKETLRLIKGISFPRDFDVEMVELRRDVPLVAEFEH
jgi:hypothetical protein